MFNSDPLPCSLMSVRIRGGDSWGAGSKLERGEEVSLDVLTRKQKRHGGLLRD